LPSLGSPRAAQANIRSNETQAPIEPPAEPVIAQPQRARERGPGRGQRLGGKRPALAIFELLTGPRCDKGQRAVAGGRQGDGFVGMGGVDTQGNTQC
jgi:hypothetical protein